MRGDLTLANPSASSRAHYDARLATDNKRPFIEFENIDRPSWIIPTKFAPPQIVTRRKYRCDSAIRAKKSPKRATSPIRWEDSQVSIVHRSDLQPSQGYVIRDHVTLHLWSRAWRAQKSIAIIIAPWRHRVGYIPAATCTCDARVCGAYPLRDVKAFRRKRKTARGRKRDGGREGEREVGGEKEKPFSKGVLNWKICET